MPNTATDRTYCQGIITSGAVIIPGLGTYAIRRFEPGLLTHDPHFHVRRRGARAIDALGRLLEIAGFGVVDIHELLRIAVGYGEPAALHLNHDAMAPAKRMADAGHHVLDFFHLARGERLGFFVTVA